MLERPSLEEALRALLDRVSPSRSESIPTREGVGRTLATDIKAPTDLPPYPQAAMDGFALSLTEPKEQEYKVKKHLGADEAADFSLQAGEAAGVLTGGYLPWGTEMVVPHEMVQITDKLISIKSWPQIDNIRQPGEDISSHTVLARKGTKISPGLIAILTAFGLQRIDVFPKPRLSIISLGKEVIPYDQQLVPGQMWDSNGPHLSALATLQGGLPSIATGISVESQLEKSDLVVTIGGTADGDNDQGRALFDDLGADPIFLGYQVKPGGHTSAGIRSGKPVIMLSGNAIACFVGYNLLVTPALMALQGLSPNYKIHKARATSTFPRSGGPRRFLLGYALCGEQGWRVAILPAQKPSMRSSLKECNCLIDLPQGHLPVELGDQLKIIPIPGLI